MDAKTVDSRGGEVGGGMDGAGGPDAAGGVEGGPLLDGSGSLDLAGDRDAGEGSDAVTGGVVCDGSTRPRLIYANTGGGPLWPSFSFSGAYGHAFFVIDGGCRYWAGGQFLEGIRTGTLTPARAQQIARDLHYDAIPRLKSFTGLPVPDASTRTISNGVESMHCTGDCTSQAPPDYAQAFTNLGTIYSALFAEAQPADLPIRVIALDPEIDRPTSSVAWPLTWSPREVIAATREPPPTSGRLVTAPTELAALRTLRASAPPRMFGVAVRHEGEMFWVLPRDEAPTVVVEGLHAAH